MANIICWTIDERVSVLNKMAEMIRSGEADIDFRLLRLRGMPELVTRAQNQILTPSRRRPINGALTAELGKALREKFKETPPPPEAPAESVPLQDPPPIPSRLGMSPKFAEALTYVAQEMVRTFAETFGQTFGEVVGDKIGRNVRDALYDLRHHLGTPSTYIPRVSGDNGKDAGLHNFGDLPERLQTPKVLVLGLLPAQQQTIARSFPNLDFRFLSKGTPSKHIQQVSQGCVKVFSMVKFVRHSDESLVPTDRLRRINGGITDLTRALMQSFPQTPYSGVRSESIQAH